MEQKIFNSRETAYKTPFGAVECGTLVQFTVNLPLEWAFATVTLIVYSEQLEQTLTMNYQKTVEGAIYYHTAFTPGEPGIYFYLFKLQKGSEVCYLKSLENADAVINHGESGRDYQLTVYESGYTTPEEIKGGVIYQIFPDRFCRSGKTNGSSWQDRQLRSDWGGQPYFLPNEQGEVTNNDYFCGDLRGIESKLGYLQELGVTMLYLNPIFEAHSNHRYNTSDYNKIDPLLGTEEDFKKLCSSAKKRGIRIILDGVFSHTGSDSVYFNKENRYPNQGAYNTPDSPYKNWFHFNRYPDDYKSWWGFLTLPELDKDNNNYIEFICGKDGVLRRWLRLGASGYRLDVADELPDSFIAEIRKAVKAEGSENLLIGEVWEDASNKLAYGVRRKYFLGSELDSVMNYPFKDAILNLLKTENREDFFNKILEIVENYPPQSLNVAMNSLSTHDTERAITVLAGQPCHGRDRNWQSHHHLSIVEYQRGLQMLRAAMAFQYFLPGLPCVYYGDEAGLQGYKDPFNRGCYPWGYENKELIAYTAWLAEIRKQAPALARGSLNFLNSPNDTILFARRDTDGELLIGVNYTNRPSIINCNLNNYNILAGDYSNEIISLEPYNFFAACLQK